MNKVKKYKSGFAIIYALLLTSTALAIVLVLSNIFIGKLKLLRESSDSIKAIFAADSGVESCLYHARKISFSVESCPGVSSQVTLSNDARFQIITLGSQSIRSVGIVNGINRALEVFEIF